MQEFNQDIENDILKSKKKMENSALIYQHDVKVYESLEIGVNYVCQMSKEKKHVDLCS